ncbi:MAG: carbon monoxide dehydrogenase [Bacillota bacterium]|nr:carbon monoxide dehydrogenase [Bacillota bacterium]
MGLQIAVAGKGGCGKTTLAALIIRYLVEEKLGPVLAVDADPNSNLGEALGLQPAAEVADILKEMSQSLEGPPAGMDRGSYVEMRIREALAEGKEVDLLAMGGPEGEGCYCYPNALLRRLCESLTAWYPFSVIDNEAGLEHLSRRFTGGAHLFLVVSDNSLRGVRSAGRVAHLADHLGLKLERRYLVVTKVHGRLSPEMEREIAATGLELGAVIPYDPLILEYDLRGRPFSELPDRSPAVRQINAFLAQWLAEVQGRRKQDEVRVAGGEMAR